MSALAGVGRLARLALRRDRVQLPLWLLGLTFAHVASGLSTLELYSDAAERADLARSSARSGVALAFNGLVSGTSEGAVVMSQTFLLVAVGAALMSTFAVVRHTRQNEQAGRAELVGASPVGRHAQTIAALVAVIGADVVLGLLNAAGLILVGLPAGGSLVAGAGIAGVGAAFAAVAAVCAQLATTSRGANGLAFAAVGAAFGLRAIGDMASETVENGTKVLPGWPSWLSPIGWGEQVRAFHEDDWRPVALLAAFTVVTIAVAFALAGRRDLGAGLLPSRPGPPRAGRGLLDPLGLAWRLQRGVLAGWAAGLVLVGLAYGAVAPEVEDLVGESEGTRDIFEQLGGGARDLTDAYLTATLGITAVAVAAYTIQATLRLRGEESGGTLEPVLAGAVSRLRWLASHVAVAAAGTLVLLALAGAAVGLAYGLASGDTSGELPRFTGAALSQAPGALVLGGLAVAAFGLLPGRATVVSWSVFALCLLLGQTGDLLGLPEPVLKLSPFTHLPAAPVERVTPAPVLALLGVAAALATLGVAAFRRRDIRA